MPRPICDVIACNVRWRERWRSKSSFHLEPVPASGTISKLRFLRRACILGAVAALPASTARGPSHVDEPVRDPPVLSQSVLNRSVRAGDRTAPAKLAALAVAHIDSVAAFSALGSAYSLPTSALDARATMAGAPKRAASRRAGVSAKASPEPFFNVLDATSPMPTVAVPPTRLAYAALPDVTLTPKPDAAPPRETADYAYLAYYAYSEVPPPEKPADTVSRALKDIPEGTPAEEVRRAARAFGLDVTFMETVVKIESDFDPKQRTGSYIGLFQLSQYEFDQYGAGNITDARDNAIAGVYKFAVAAILFELATHQKATPAYLYLIHQQGTQGAAEHVGHPERLAWESMCATDEGKLKGERWCKRAIWENTLPEVKKAWGSVEKLTSAAFVTMWSDRVAALYQRYSNAVSTSPLH
jgi:hypothetical protein